MIGTAQTAHYSEDGAVCQYVRGVPVRKQAVDDHDIVRQGVFESRGFLLFCEFSLDLFYPMD
jgi:hypothetical protein